jgi:predicted nucleic acid-binding protein
LKTYFDTSCLVALYVPNDHTRAALRYRERAGGQPILFTPLHRLELRTTVRQCAHGGLIKQTVARQILRHIEEDLDDGTLIHQPVDWTESLRQAETVAERLAWSKMCRSLDLWHVAIALEIQAGPFVTFDNDQFALAETAGLHAITPRA